MTELSLFPRLTDSFSRLLQGSNRRQALLAASGGLLATSALPPWHLWPLLPLAFALLLGLLDQCTTLRRAFGLSFLWGVMHFSAGHYWLANALLIQPELFGWLIPFAVFGLGSVLACFPALASALAWRFTPSGPARLLLFAAAWALMEWVRSWIFTGFPWNLMATVALPSLPLTQFAALTGAFGLSWLVVIAALLPLLLLYPVRRLSAMLLGGGITLLLGVWLWGAQRIPAQPSPVWPELTLRLVQGNIPQSAKWDPALRNQHLLTYARLSQAYGTGRQPDVIIWPESAIPYLMEEDSPLYPAISRIVPPNGYIITGDVRSTGEAGTGTQRLWNSLEAIGPDGKVAARYDKNHLVPFGEYVPFAGILPLRHIVPLPVDISSGKIHPNLLLSPLPEIGPSICFEDIFPGNVRDPAHRPQWLLSVTNDGWFGEGAGPQQHFAAARLRAVEDAVPLVRVANTGVSAVTDPFGRIVSAIEPGMQAFADSELPLPEKLSPPYALFGNALFFVILFTSGLGSLLMTWKRADRLQSLKLQKEKIVVD